MCFAGLSFFLLTSGKILESWAPGGSLGRYRTMKFCFANLRDGGMGELEETMKEATANKPPS